ncbi:MAG: hypothetical protein ABR881_18860 [Candidatus Sulfotelmatobacter sp.]
MLHEQEEEYLLQDRAKRFETFVVWYLRFNGYFTVPSFVVHAGNDCTRISGGVIGNRTEVDTIAIRLPYSREESGMRFPTDRNLVENAEGRFDVVFAEVKSGKKASPNKIWRNGEVRDIEYLLRFLGWHKDDNKIASAAKALSKHYIFEEPNLRVRYVIFAKHIDTTWNGKGVKYITFDDCIRFISEERGQCWASLGIGWRSMHDQWNPLIKRLFEIANSVSLSSPCRQMEIRRVLENGP